MGKSRFVYEFTRIDATHDWRVLGRRGCPTARSPLAPGQRPAAAVLRDRGRRRAGVDPGESHQRSIAPAGRPESHLAPLLSLLDIPVDDPSWRISIRRSTAGGSRRDKRLLLHESRIQPLLLIVEDLHWIDAETQACSTASSRACRPRGSSRSSTIGPSISIAGGARPTTASCGSMRCHPRARASCSMPSWATTRR